MAFNALGKPKKAISYYKQALAIDENVFGKEHPNVATTLNNLGLVYYQLGQIVRARSYVERAYTIFKKIYGEEHPDTKNAKLGLKACG